MRMEGRKEGRMVTMKECEEGRSRMQVRQEREY